MMSTGRARVPNECDRWVINFKVEFYGRVLVVEEEEKFIEFLTTT